MKRPYLGLKTFLGTALLAAPIAAGGPTARVQAPTTGPQATVGNVTGLGGASGVFSPGNTVTPGLTPSILPNVGNDNFPGSKYEGAAAPDVIRREMGGAVREEPASGARSGVSPAPAPAPAAQKLGKSVLSNSNVDRGAFNENAAPSEAGAPVSAAKTGIAAVDGGLAQAMGRIRARKQPGAGGVAPGTDQGDLDKLFEQIGKRNSAAFGEAAGKDAGAVAVKEIDASPQAQVRSHAAQAVRSMAEAKAAGRAGQASTELQRLSEAGQFIIKARSVVRENELPAEEAASSFSRMRRAAEALGPKSVALLADAAIAAAGRADKNAAFDYGNQFDAMSRLLTDASGRPYIAGYGAVLNSLKRGLAETVGRTSADRKETFASVSVEEFSGSANPRVRLTLPLEFAKVAALNEADFVASLKLAPDAVASLDEGLGLAVEGAAMHAAMKFVLNTQGFADHRRSADAALARRQAANPLGLRGFFIAARRVLSESMSGLWRWILSALRRMGLLASAGVPAAGGIVVSTEGLAALRAREARTYARPRRLPTADYAGYIAIPVH